MSPYISELFRKMMPEYQTAYRDGFEAGKRAAIREMKRAIASTKDKEPFCTTSATFPSSQSGQ
jgi:hypothetical protein